MEKDTYTKLCLNEVVELVHLLGEYTDVELEHADFNKKGIDYSIDKVDNSFLVRSSEDKTFAVMVEATKEEVEKSDRIEIHLKHIVNVDYFLTPGTVLKLNSYLSLPEGYKAFTDVYRHNLFEYGKYELSYYGDSDEKEGSITTTFNDVKLANNFITYHFHDEFIETDNKKISTDGNELIEFFDRPVPSMEDVNSFDVELLRKKAKLVGMSELFTPINDSVVNAINRNIECQRIYFEGIKDYYNKEKKDVQKAIEIRKNVIEGTNNLLTDEELRDCIKAIAPKLALRREYNANKEEISNVLKKSL